MSIGKQLITILKIFFSGIKYFIVIELIIGVLQLWLISLHFIYTIYHILVRYNNIIFIITLNMFNLLPDEIKS